MLMPEVVQTQILVERAADIFKENFPVGTICWIPDRHLKRVVQDQRGNGIIRVGLTSLVGEEPDPSELFSDPPRKIENLDFPLLKVTLCRMGEIVNISGEASLPYMNRTGVVVQYKFLGMYAVQIGKKFHPVKKAEVAYGGYFVRLDLRIMGEPEGLPKSVLVVNVAKNTIDVVYVPAGFDYKAFLAEVIH